MVAKKGKIAYTEVSEIYKVQFNESRKLLFMEIFNESKVIPFVIPFILCHSKRDH